MSNQNKITIHGPGKINGVVTPIKNKNAVMATIPACLLTNEDVFYPQLPQTSDVTVMLEILRRLGATITATENGNTKINTSNVSGWKIPAELSSKNRASILFLGPLLTRFGKAGIGEVGGCKLGKRPFDDHLLQLAKFGAKINQDSQGFWLETENSTKPQELIWLKEPSVTVTENLMLAAARIEQETVIYNAACEPHIQDLAEMINKMGAKITGAGSNEICILGKKQLSGTTAVIGVEFLDVGALIAAAYITGGKLKIEGVDPLKYQNIIQCFQDLGVEIQISPNYLLIPQQTSGQIRKDFLGRTIKLKAGPWPSLPVDLIPLLVVTALFSSGQVIIQNHMFDSALDWTDQLQKMGASLYQGNPMEVYITGPNKLTGATLSSRDIIQAGVAMTLAGMGAQGETIIEDAQAIGRRYPDIVQTYQQLGVDIAWG